LHATIVQLPEVQPVVSAFGRLQTFPQLPQLFVSVPVLVSQPSAELPLQSAVFAGQLVTAHVPAEQIGVPVVDVHFLPHTPQLLTSLAAKDSHPLLGSLSQLFQPAEHEATAHVPLEQATFAFWSWQTRPHRPQLFGSAAVFFSQPSVRLLLQSVQPVWQVPIPQLPPVQAAVSACAGTEHCVAQLPQRFTSCWRFDSQPSEGLLLQSAKPVPHEPTVQWPLTQAEPPFAVVHTELVQAPQW
jgi:hypothetical protein